MPRRRIRTGSRSGVVTLGSGRNYKVNYDKPSTPTPSILPPASLSLVVPIWQNVNTDNVNADVNERSIESFKYDHVKHLKHILARLHILDLL